MIHASFYMGMRGDLGEETMSTKLTTEEIERVKVLVAEGLSYRAIGRALTRDHKTIAAIATAPEVAIDIVRLKKELADEYEELARRMLTSIKDVDIEKINAYQRTLSAAVATDKMRLLRDQSTQNISQHTLIEELQGAKEDLLRQMRELEEA